MAMFPPSIPLYFIKKYTSERDIVLDPFSGRGTTALEACMNNRHGIGNDRSPLAYVLTFAKVKSPGLRKLYRRIDALNTEYQKTKDKIDDSEESWEIKMLYSDYTLKQLIFLKRKLRWKSNNVDAFISALILGIMHGNSDGYLSISMPNTFSMSPNYIKGYVEKHKLERPKRNVFELLKRKIGNCYDQTPIAGKVYMGDARRIKRVKSGSVKLVVTSPPYTRVIRYGAFNWIRLWFLNKKADEVDKKLHCSQSLPKYQKFMTEVLTETKRHLSTDGTAVFVIGDVKDKQNDEVLNLAEFVWENCAKPLGFKLKEPIHADIIRDDTKVTKIWGETRGRATKIDRVLVMEKNS